MGKALVKVYRPQLEKLLGGEIYGAYYDPASDEYIIGLSADRFPETPLGEIPLTATMTITEVTGTTVPEGTFVVKQPEITP